MKQSAFHRDLKRLGGLLLFAVPLSLSNDFLWVPPPPYCFGMASYTIWDQLLCLNYEDQRSFSSLVGRKIKSPAASKAFTWRKGNSNFILLVRNKLILAGCLWTLCRLFKSAKCLCVQSRLLGKERDIQSTKVFLQKRSMDIHGTDFVFSLHSYQFLPLGLTQGKGIFIPKHYKLRGFACSILWSVVFC